MIGQRSSDRELVDRMLAGQDEAFENFFKIYFPGLYRFALARLGSDRTASEEVAQSALCKAMSKLATYRGEAALFTWLCTFCRHEIANYLKNSKVIAWQDLVEDDPEVVAALESLLITAERPDRAVLRKELAEVVRNVLNALPPHYADVLEWKYIDGLAVKEIADKMSLGLKAAESLMTRARQSFRDAFSSLHPGIITMDQLLNAIRFQYLIGYHPLKSNIRGWRRIDPAQTSFCPP